MKNSSTATGQRCLDLQEEATYIFRSISSLSQKSQARALSRFLTQTSRSDPQPLRGILSDYSRTQIQQLIYLLMDRNFIAEASNTLFLTEKGRRYLLQPQPVMVWGNQLRLKSIDRVLYQELRKLRQILGTQEQVRPYIIFPDHSMDQLVRKHPQNLRELQEIYGWGPNRCNKYGAAVLACIQEVKEEHANSRFQELLNRSKRNSYQEVKSLYLAGESPQEIADKRNVKVSTVKNMLSELYEIGEVDMYPWIEQNIPPAVFEKGADYFRQNKNSRIKDAFRQLGIDYEILKLCRLYVSQVQEREEEFSVHE